MISYKAIVFIFYLLVTINYILNFILIVILAKYLLNRYTYYLSKNNSKNLTYNYNYYQQHIYVVLDCLENYSSYEDSLFEICKSKYKNLHIYVLAKQDFEYNDTRVKIISTKKVSLDSELLNQTFNLINKHLELNNINQKKSLFTVINHQTSIPKYYFENINELISNDIHCYGIYSFINKHYFDFETQINSIKYQKLLNKSFIYESSALVCTISNLNLLGNQVFNEENDLFIRLNLNTPINKNLVFNSNLYLFRYVDKFEIPEIISLDFSKVKFLKKIITSKNINKQTKIKLIIEILNSWILLLCYIITYFLIILSVILYLLFDILDLMFMLTNFFIIILLISLFIDIINSIFILKSFKFYKTFKNILNNSLFLIKLSYLFYKSFIMYLKSLKK